MHDPPHCGAYLYRRLTSAHGGLARRVRVVTMVTPQLSTALGSFCWPDVVMWDWLQRQKKVALAAAALGPKQFAPLETSVGPTCFL